jgi:hypothetical protein
MSDKASPSEKIAAASACIQAWAVGELRGKKLSPDEAAQVLWFVVEERIKASDTPNTVRYRAQMENAKAFPRLDATGKAALMEELRIGRELQALFSAEADGGHAIKASPSALRSRRGSLVITHEALADRYLKHRVSCAIDRLNGARDVLQTLTLWCNGSVLPAREEMQAQATVLRRLCRDEVLAAELMQKAEKMSPAASNMGKKAQPVTVSDAALPGITFSVAQLDEVGIGIENGQPVFSGITKIKKLQEKLWKSIQTENPVRIHIPGFSIGELTAKIKELRNAASDISDPVWRL